MRKEEGTTPGGGGGEGGGSRRERGKGGGGFDVPEEEPLCTPSFRIVTFRLPPARPRRELEESKGGSGCNIRGGVHVVIHIES